MKGCEIIRDLRTYIFVGKQAKMLQNGRPIALLEGILWNSKQGSTKNKEQPSIA
jgi:hypothetical protein